jgi:basic membrane lipoprotein Med (substrate-binding protein (PBP1-ABC) superfamily)
MSKPGPRMLGSTVKRLDRAVDFAISSDLDGFHPQGKIDIDIGIERNAVGLDVNPRAVPAWILAGSA